MSEPKYRLTLKGLIGQELWDDVELYGYRADCNAILLKDGGSFIKVEEVKNENRKSK